MKKFLRQKKSKVLETIDNNNLGSLIRTFLSSLVVLFFILFITFNNKFY